jgi:hypothetical protein
MHEFGFVGCRHDDEIRQAREIGDIEAARVRRTVGADEARAVDGETHGQFLDRHVVHDLIVTALQERRVDRRKRFAAFRGQTGRKRHGVLLGNADVEEAVGKFAREEIEAGAGRHRRRHCNDVLVLPGLLHEAFTEHFGVGGRDGL